MLLRRLMMEETLFLFLGLWVKCKWTLDRWMEGVVARLATPCSFGLSATSQQYFSLRTNQAPATSQQYFSLRTNQHQPSAISQTNRLQVWDQRTTKSKELGIELVCMWVIFFGSVLIDHQPNQRLITKVGDRVNITFSHRIVLVFY
jgi:hypothetical protein